MLTIDTARLRLQPCTVGAAQAASTDRAALEAQLGVRVPEEWPAVDLRDFLPVYGQLVGEAAANAGWGIWLMLLPAEGTLAGDIGFKGPPGADGTVEIGYSVLPAWQGRGFATEAARALVAWAQAQPRVRRVVAESLADNAASIRVLEKAGFRRTGQRDDLLLWEIPPGAVVQ